MRKKNWHTIKKSKMKGNFWRKIFRKGYNGHGYHSAQFNGTMSKQDATASRARMNKLMDKIASKIPQEDIPEEFAKVVKEHFWDML